MLLRCNCTNQHTFSLDHHQVSEVLASAQSFKRRGKPFSAYSVRTSQLISQVNQVLGVDIIARLR